MSESASANWLDANQRYLSAALATVRFALESQIARTQGKPEEAKYQDKAERAVKKAAQAMPGPPALEILCATFGLSAFERALLLLCAGMELDARFPGLCAAAQGDPLCEGRPYEYPHRLSGSIAHNCAMRASPPLSARYSSKFRVP